jgi:hypothetical protein
MDEDKQPRWKNEEADEAEQADLEVKQEDADEVKGGRRHLRGADRAPDLSTHGD